MKKLYFILTLVLAIGFTSCKKAPTCSITLPQDGASFTNAENISINVVAEDEDGVVAKVVLYIDDVKDSTIVLSPYNFTISTVPLPTGSHEIRVEAVDNDGKVGEAFISITITQAHLYSVGDYYNVSGVEGVVYKITDNGAHGMIVSMDETGHTIYQWSDSNVTTGAIDSNDGSVNMAIIKNNFDINDYPAFKWCNDKNTGGITGWYLPTANDVLLLYSKRWAIDDTLEYYGGTKFDDTPWLWTSTEVDSTNALVFSYGVVYSDSKDHGCPVRAVRAF